MDALDRYLIEELEWPEYLQPKRVQFTRNDVADWALRGLQLRDQIEWGLLEKQWKTRQKWGMTLRERSLKEQN